jgi:hypothetical protein
MDRSTEKRGNVEIRVRKVEKGKKEKRKKSPTHEAKLVTHGSLFASPTSAAGGPDRILQIPGTAGL